MGKEKRLLKAMQRNPAFEKLTFPANMYSNVYGSLIICGYIFTPDKKSVDVKKISETWKRVTTYGNREITWGLSDKGFIRKTLEFFGMKIPKVFPIAFVQSRVNCLFAPYMDGQILPLREDGFLPHTLMRGKIYPIKFGGKMPDVDTIDERPDKAS